MLLQLLPVNDADGVGVAVDVVDDGADVVVDHQQRN